MGSGWDPHRDGDGDCGGKAGCHQSGPEPSLEKPVSGLLSAPTCPLVLGLLANRSNCRALRLRLFINHVLNISSSTHGCQHIVDLGLRNGYGYNMTRDVESLADHFMQLGCQEVSDGLTDGREATLAELRFADSLRRSAERQSQRSAEAARQQGASWREIGEAVGGITPQGAEHRFSAAAKERRSKASKAEWASKERRRTPRVEAAEDRSYLSERS